MVYVVVGVLDEPLSLEERSRKDALSQIQLKQSRPNCAMCEPGLDPDLMKKTFFKN